MRRRRESGSFIILMIIFIVALRCGREWPAAAFIEN
jgi:hypothetical protein